MENLMNTTSTNTLSVCWSVLAHDERIYPSDFQGQSLKVKVMNKCGVLDLEDAKLCIVLVTLKILYAGHRMDTFGHFHHPLKALRSRSHKNVRQLQKEKPKKKKKKKRTMHTVNSFPSKSALQSPPIREESEEHDHSEGDKVYFLGFDETLSHF